MATSKNMIKLKERKEIIYGKNFLAITITLCTLIMGAMITTGAMILCINAGFNVFNAIAIAGALTSTITFVFTTFVLEALAILKHE